MAKARAKVRRRPAARRASSSGWSRRRLILAAVVVALVALRVFALDAYHISAASMEDTLLKGDLVLIERLSYGSDWLPDLSAPAAGDVIVFRRPEGGGVMIKRCVATAGQRVEVDRKVLYIDGERAADPPRSKYLDASIQSRSASPRDHFGPYVVPPGHVFVLGDNRDESLDSRFFGPVAQPMLIGRAIAVVWPAAGVASRWSRLGDGTW